jgi:oligopeptide transport system permease protein
MQGGTFAYLMRRLLWVPLILFVVSAVTFTLARLGPGDPISILQGQFRDPEVRDLVRKQRGLDKPIWDQYYIYMKRLLTKGDLGQSYRYQGRSVREVLAPAIWRSFQFNVVALTIVIGLGIPVGIYAARRQGSWTDPLTISAFLLLAAIPVFLWVPALWLVFALKLGILPARGWPQDCPVHLDFLGQNYSCIGVISKEAVIPIIALSLPSIASWARYVRGFTLEVMNEDYIRTARAKGISEFTVMSRHVLRNALLPLSTLIGFSLIGLLEGSFFLETLTGIPGAGLLTFNSIGSRDYDMIMAVVLLGASSFALASIAIDIGYTLIDPRIRYGARS